MTDLCNEIEKFGKGLGNSSRYRIAEALFTGPMTVNEIVHKVRQSQPAVSQNLKTLKACGLVKSHRKGREILYSLDTAYTLNLLKKLATKVRHQRKEK
jgi:DNA-binding transcriptional ArsR family regulator